MKKHVYSALLSMLVVAICVGCATVEQSAGKPGKLDVKTVKRPDVIDHKNMKWGKEPPDWVSLERDEIEKSGRYGEVYVFKFESEKGKDLDGSQLWLKNFSVGSEIARLISQRVEDKAAAAAAGNKDKIGGYTKELVKIVSEATINGLKKESDYWIQQRFYTAEGEVEGDFYSAYILYTVPKQILDDIIKDAIMKAQGKVPPVTPEEKDAQEEVRKAFEAGF